MAKLVLPLLLIAITYATADPYHYNNCPRLGNPNYGHVTIADAIARYYCNSGYGMYSNQYGLYPLGSYYQRSCVNGHWAGAVPNCVLYRNYYNRYNNGAHMYEHANYYYGHAGYPNYYGYGGNYPYGGNYAYNRNYPYNTGSYRNNYQYGNGNYRYNTDYYG